MAVDALLKQFMPPSGPVPAPKAKPQQKQKPSDRESDPAVQDARALCGYADRILEDILKDYELSAMKWDEAFGEILAAVAIANQKRDETLGAVNEERAQDAARAAFINNLAFSLLTIGVMAYVGEFVKAGLPKATAKEVTEGTTYSWLASKITPGGIPYFTVNSTPVFTQFQASLFGTLVKDVGNRLVPLAFPKPPENVPYRIDSSAGLWSLRQDFSKNVGESKALVLGEFKKVQQWLNQESEFGEAWLAFIAASISAVCGSCRRLHTSPRLTQ